MSTQGSDGRRLRAAGPAGRGSLGAPRGEGDRPEVPDLDGGRGGRARPLTSIAIACWSGTSASFADDHLVAARTHPSRQIWQPRSAEKVDLANGVFRLEPQSLAHQEAIAPGAYRQPLVGSGNATVKESHGLPCFDTDEATRKLDLAIRQGRESRFHEPSLVWRVASEGDTQGLPGFANDPGQDLPQMAYDLPPHEVSNGPSHDSVARKLRRAVLLGKPQPCCIHGGEAAARVDPVYRVPGTRVHSEIPAPPNG